MKTTIQIFLSYARPDKEKVEELYQKLSDAGFKPWMDGKDILPGEKWELSIQKAIECSDFFLACLSANSVNKRGSLQKEIKDALGIWQEKLEDDIYLIPVRLEHCEVPESLRKFQWVDLFEEDEWTRLAKAIQVGIERRAEGIKPAVQESILSEPYPAHDKPSPGTEIATPIEGAEIRMAGNQNYDSDLLEGTYQLALRYYQAEDWSNAVKWLSKVVERDPKHEDAAVLLQKAKGGLKQIEYEAGVQALHEKRWHAACEHFEKVDGLDSSYRDVVSRLEHAKKGLELPKLYASVQEPFRREEWDVIIPKLQEIVRIDKGFRDANSQLSWALRGRQAAQQYIEAMKQYEVAQQKDGEVDWRRAIDLLKKVNRTEPGYKGVNRELTTAKTQLKLVIHYNKGSWRLDRHQWLRAIWHLSKAYRIDSTHDSIAWKLQQAKQGLSNQWQKGPFGIPWRRAVAILGIAFTTAGLIFANQFATVGDHAIKWWLESRATPTPTVAIPGIDRIEVWMDGGQLNLNRLPSLASGQAVMLEVVVFDTNGKRYTSDALVCKWLVAPLGDEDTAINTDLCKTLYTPSQEYSSQTVVVEVRGREQQFESSDPISMKFDIAK